MGLRRVIVLHTLSRSLDVTLIVVGAVYCLTVSLTDKLELVTLTGSFRA